MMGPLGLFKNLRTAKLRIISLIAALAGVLAGVPLSSALAWERTNGAPVPWELDLPTGATIVCTFGLALIIMAVVRPIIQPHAVS